MKPFRTILLCALCGCTTVAQKTIQATGAVAETTLKVGGKITKTAVASTIDIAGAAFKKGVVTVIDSANGISHEIPWEEGLRVSKVQAARGPVEIVRGSQRIKGAADTVLRAGDVVRLP
jgi:predicted nucleic-acid-binding Zn-ribbon protein